MKSRETMEVEIVECLTVSKSKPKHKLKKNIKKAKHKLGNKKKKLRFNLPKTHKIAKLVKRLCKKRTSKKKATSTTTTNAFDESYPSDDSNDSPSVECWDSFATHHDETLNGENPAIIVSASEVSELPSDSTSKSERLKRLDGTDRMRSFQTQDKKCILAIPRGTSIGVRGRVGVCALRGSVDVLGFRLDIRKGRTCLYSPRSSSALTITACTQNDWHRDDSATLDCFPLRRKAREELALLWLDEEYVFVLLDDVDEPSNRLLMCCHPNLYEASDNDRVAKLNFESSRLGFAFVRPNDKCIMKIPTSWSDVQAQLKHDHFMEGQDLRILVCGGKGAGKSTMTRYLMNSFLAQSKNVCLLDCDPGQSECTPPGCVSLCAITNPLLGPPFTHQQVPLKSIFFGDVSVRTNPTYYIECIEELFEHYRCSKSLTLPPLFINTMGWVEGLGLSLFMDIVHITKPTHIVQIYMGNSLVWNFEELTPEYIAEQDGWVFRSDGTCPSNHKLIRIHSIRSTKEETYKASVLRDLHVLSYFGSIRNPRINFADSLNAVTPYKVPWSAIAIAIFFETIPLHKIMYALNCSLVGLGKCDPDMLQQSDDDTLPKFLPAEHWVFCDCIGYGIIRGIDMEKKLFYVITPMDLSEVSNVNVILKGSLRIPDELIFKQKIEGSVPYAAIISKGENAVGDMPVSRRSYRLRIPMKSKR